MVWLLSMAKVTMLPTMRLSLPKTLPYGLIAAKKILRGIDMSSCSVVRQERVSVVRLCGLGLF